MKQSSRRTIYRVLSFLTPWSPRSSRAEVVASVMLHTCTYMWGLIPSSCVWNAHIHSCLLSGLLGKRCKKTELSFACVLLRTSTTHWSPGILAHNTLISWHFGTSTTRSRNIAGTQLLRYITWQAFNVVYILHEYTIPYHAASEVQTLLVFPLNSILNIADRQSSRTPDVTSHSIWHCNQHTLLAFVYSGRASLLK